MEFFKKEPEDPPNEEIEYYKPENLQNGLVNSVSNLNPSPPKPKAAKKRKRTRRFVFSVPKRKNKKKNDPAVSVEQNSGVTSLDDSSSTVSKEIESNDSSDTVILSDDNSINRELTTNNVEFPLLHDVLIPKPLVKVAGSPKSRKRKGKKAATRVKSTKNELPSSELPVLPETYAANNLTNVQSKLPNVAAPSTGHLINLSGTEMVLNPVSSSDADPDLKVKRKEPVKRSKPQSPRCRKKPNSTVKIHDYSSLDDTINFVATACYENQDLYNIPIVENTLKKTARKKTGEMLTEKMVAPCYDSKMTVFQNSLPLLKTDKILLLPVSAPITQGTSYPIGKRSSKRFCVSRVPSEDLPPHVNLTFEEDVSEKQTFPEDLSHLLGLNENPLLNLNHNDSPASNTKELSKVSSSFNALEHSDSNSSVSFLPSRSLSNVSSPKVNIKSEITESQYEPNLPLLSKDPIDALNIKKEIVETNYNEPTCTLTKVSNKESEHSELSQKTAESSLANAIGSLPIKRELESVPESQVLNNEPFPTSKGIAWTTLCSDVIEKEPRNSLNQVNLNTTKSLTQESEVSIVTVKEKEKRQEIEVICLDDSSSDSISFVASDSNQNAPKSVIGGTKFNLNTQLDLTKKGGSVIKTEFPQVAEKELGAAKNGSNPTLPVSLSQFSVPNPGIVAMKDNSLQAHFSSTPSNDSYTFGETLVNANTSRISKEVAVDNHALELNIVNIKKEIEDHSSSVAVVRRSENNFSSEVRPLTPTNNSCATGQSQLSNVDRCIESVIQSGKVAETDIEHPLDLLQSIKKEVLEDDDLYSTESLNNSSPIPKRVNDLDSNYSICNTSQSLVKQAMPTFQSGIDTVNIDAFIESTSHSFSLESEEVSRTSMINENTDTLIELENSSISSSKNKTNSYESSINNSETLADKERELENSSTSSSINKTSLFESSINNSETLGGKKSGSMAAIDGLRTYFNFNNNIEHASENTEGSDKYCEINVNHDNVSNKEMNVFQSEHDNDSKCSFTSGTSCSVSENQCLTDHIGEKENLQGYDFDFDACVTKYLRKIRYETENSKRSEEGSNETNGSTVSKDCQGSDKVVEKAVEDTSCSSLPTQDSKTDLAHETASEQGSEDTIVLNPLEKLRLNMDRYFKNNVPSFLVELNEEQKLFESCENRSLYEIFPYDVVASNLQAAAERSLNSTRKEVGIGLKDFPVVEEEIECYYRLLNVEPRLISTSGVDDLKNSYEEKKTAECASDVEVKITSETKEDEDDQCPSKNSDSVTSEKSKVIDEVSSNKSSYIEEAEKNAAEEVEIIDLMSDDPDVEQSVVAPTSKSVLDSNTFVCEENSKGASKISAVSNEPFNAILVENIKQESNSSQNNIEAEMEVDLELRQLACESLKNISSAETESCDIMELNFMNRVPMSSEVNVEETLPSKLTEATVGSQDTPLQAKLDQQAEILVVDLISPVPSPKSVDVEDVCNVNDEPSCNEFPEILNVCSGVESETNETTTSALKPILDVQTQPLPDASAAMCDPLPQEQIQANPEESQAALPAIDMSVTDLLSILQTAQSLPTETTTQSVGEVKFIQSYDYGHGIQHKTRETYSEPAYCSTGRDFFPALPPSIQFEIVHEYGHKPPVDSISESFDQSPPKNDLKNSEAIAFEGEEGSEDELYTVESEIICNSDVEDEELESTEQEKIEKSAVEKSSKSTEEKPTENEVKDFPQYKSRWERIMERKESENKEVAQFGKCTPLKSLPEKPISKPVALVQPRSQTVTEPKTTSIKDSYKLLSAKANLVTHKKKRKKEKDSKTKSDVKKGKHASPKIKNKTKSPKRNIDDASLLFTPDKASKPKRRGLLPTPPSYKRTGGKDSESKRVYGRVFNRGGFLTESSSDTKQVPVSKPKKVQEKRKKRFEGKETEEFHSMINLPIIDHIPLNKVIDPRTESSPKPRFSSFGKPSVYFKPLGSTTSDSFSDLSSSQRSSPLLPVPPVRYKAPLLPDPIVPPPPRPTLLTSPLSFDKLLTKTLSNIPHPRKSWPDPTPSTSNQSKADDIYSPSRSLSPPSISSDSPVSSGGISPSSDILPPPVVVPPPPVIVQQPPPPHKHPRTRNTGCICLPPKTLKPLVGNAVFETINVLLLILEWNVDWLVQQQKNPEPPPISNTVHKVKNEYTSFEEYYNCYLPLVLLETWQRIYVSWTHLHQAPPYFCQITSYEVEKHSTKVKCQVIFNYVERDKGIFPEEGNIVMVKFGTKDKGGIKILGYLTDVEVDAYNVTDSNHRALARLLKNANPDHLQLLTMTFVGAYTSDDFDINQLVRIHVLCNIQTILKQNDALLHSKKSPLFGNILNPLSDGLRTVTMVTRNPDPHKVAQSVSECVKEIIQGIVTMHPIPLLTIVRSVPSSDKLLVLPPLIEKMKDSYKTKVLFCTRTSKALADIGFNLESCSAKVVIIGKRADVHQKLRKYMVDDLASNKVYEAHAKTRNGVPFLEDSIKGDVLQKAKMDVLYKSDVILTLVRNCHDDLVVKLCEDGDVVSRMCCILDEANLCTEPEILIPLLYGISKLILIGDPDVPSKVCSKTAAKFQFNKSLFHRAFELDTMNE